MLIPNKTDAIKKAFAYWGLEAHNQSIIQYVLHTFNVHVSTQHVTNVRRVLLITESKMKAIDKDYLNLINRLLTVRGKETLLFTIDLIERLKHDYGGGSDVSDVRHTNNEGSE